MGNLLIPYGKLPADGSKGLTLPLLVYYDNFLIDGNKVSEKAVSFLMQVPCFWTGSSWTIWLSKALDNLGVGFVTKVSETD